MFIEYESKKGIKKRFSVDKVVDAFAVTRDAVKDWKADLRVSLGKFEVEAAIERAHAAGQRYVQYLKKCEDGEHEVEQHMCEDVEQAFGKPALLREAIRYRARSKKVVGKMSKNRK